MSFRGSSLWKLYGNTWPQKGDFVLSVWSWTDRSLVATRDWLIDLSLGYNCQHHHKWFLPLIRCKQICKGHLSIKGDCRVFITTATPQIYLVHSISTFFYPVELTRALLGYVFSSTIFLPITFFQYCRWIQAEWFIFQNYRKMLARIWKSITISTNTLMDIFSGCKASRDRSVFYCHRLHIISLA
jgi:hypothetical protein